MPKISIIIPCYFNEANLPVTFAQLFDNEQYFPENTAFEYVMVDDGSKDNTYGVLLQFHAAYPQKIKVIKLASNVGSYNAITAGMHYATGHCCAVMAADLQDPPEMIVKMYDYWLKGIKLVIANRENRDDAFSDKLFSNLFQYLIRKFGLKNLPKGGYDFVLFDARLKDQVLRIKEKNTNILYLLLWLGYDYVNIPYIRQKRAIGRSKWTFSKKIKLFIDSFVSFSYLPIRMISATGLVLGFSAFLYAILLIINKLFGFISVEGWTTMMVVMVLLGAFQMIALGIIGEYVWRTLDTTRQRPDFVVEKEHKMSDE